MKKETQNELREKVVALVLKEGRLVHQKEDIYGWVDYDNDKHLHRVRKGLGSPCPIITPTAELDYEEENVDLFESTFDGNSIISVIDVSYVSCECGMIEDRTLRVEKNLSEIITQVTR